MVDYEEKVFVVLWTEHSHLTLKRKLAQTITTKLFADQSEMPVLPTGC